MVGHPAHEEGQHNDGDRLGDLGHAFGVAGFHAALVDEAQQHEVADGHDDHGQHEAHSYFLDVIKRQPVLSTGEAQQAQLLSCHVGHCGENRGRRGRQSRQSPDESADPLGGAGLVRCSVLQSRRHRPVARHAHGSEEEDAGVHVHHGDRQDDLAHGVSKGPAEVHHGVHGPEGQREHKLQVRHGQVEHEEVYPRLPPVLFHSDEEEDQHIAHQPSGAHHGVNDADEEPESRTPVCGHVDVLQVAEEVQLRLRHVGADALIVLTHVS